MKPLEALERLRPNTTNMPYYTKSERRHCCDIIEKALKEYEQYEKILKDYGFNLANFREACFTLAQFRGEGFAGIEKKLKALEIIKEKGINVAYFQNFVKNVGKYKDSVYDYENILTKKEYDLLKEVLTND